MTGSMAETGTRPPKKKSQTERMARKSAARRGMPTPWYRRRALALWVVGAVVIAIVAFNVNAGSEQGGTPEQPVSLPVVGGDLHSFIVDPSDPNRLYIGSHDGVSISEDGGKTWAAEPTLDGADAMGWALADDAMLVGGHPGISVSTDGGETFEQRNEGLPATDVHALGAGAGTIYAASPAAGVFASSDGARSWDMLTDQAGQGFMGRILVDPRDPKHAVAPDMEAGAVETTDGGRTWDALGGVRGAMWISWDEADTDHLVVTGQGVAAESVDGGDSWQPIDIPEGASIVDFSPHDPDVLYAAVLEAPQASVYVSDDAGATWIRP